MADPVADALREMAINSGLKLVRSRRRKPGGDFGKFGLTDPDTGKACFGVSKDGLTATADEIEDYLRKRVSARWSRSLKSTPKAAPSKAAKPAGPKTSPEPIRRKARTERPETRAPAVPHHRPQELRQEPAPAAEPALQIRAATSDDMAAVAHLVADGSRDNPRTVRKRLDALAPEPPLVAYRDDLVGVCAFHVVPTLVGPRIGRIIHISVVKSEQRIRVGTALVDAAKARLRKLKCEVIEVSGDIDMSGTRLFFRKLGFLAKGYRLVCEG